MKYKFYTADIFTDTMFGGNQLAVLPDARGLSDTQMQQIAREFNLAETTFVFPPESHEGTRKLRIFTPGTEVPFAGHPTVGTAFVLAAIGEVPLDGEGTNVIFEEGVGPVPVTIKARDGYPDFCQLTTATPPERGPTPPDSGAMAAALSLRPEDLDADHAPEAFSCGLPFLFVPLKNLDAVRRACLRLDEWKSLTKDYWTQLVYLFCTETQRPDANIHARMFAPAFGVEEDPATGSAASAVAGCLEQRDHTGDGCLRWRIEQGLEVGRPSIIDVEAERKDGALTSVRVGGRSVMVTRGEIDLG